jgi:7,8-dihydro-6-hydroxymethylpterin-pyrophosphokinase
LTPVQLLQLLKTIESKVGRKPTIRNGPRIVDLDIIFYDDLILDTRPPSERATLGDLTGQLLIPHPRIQEREFALRPITEYVSYIDLNKNLTLHQHDPGLCSSCHSIISQRTAQRTTTGAG